jgi:hypothetical protein
MSTVTQITAPARVDDRACAAMRRFLAALEELRSIRLEDADAVAIFLPELDKADTDIALLRAGLRTRAQLRKSLGHLAGQFGRAP